MDPSTGEVAQVSEPPATVRLRIFDKPFALGAYRSAHWALVDGKPHVAKRYLGAGSDADTNKTLQEVTPAHAPSAERELYVLLACLKELHSLMWLPSLLVFLKCTRSGTLSFPSWSSKVYLHFLLTVVVQLDLAAHVKACCLTEAFNEAVGASGSSGVPTIKYHQPSVCILAAAANASG